MKKNIRFLMLLLMLSPLTLSHVSLAQTTDNQNASHSFWSAITGVFDTFIKHFIPQNKEREALLEEIDRVNALNETRGVPVLVSTSTPSKMGTHYVEIPDVPQKKSAGVSPKRQTSNTIPVQFQPDQPGQNVSQEDFYHSPESQYLAQPLDGGPTQPVTCPTGAFVDQNGQCVYPNDACSYTPTISCPAPSVLVDQVICNLDAQSVFANSKAEANRLCQQIVKDGCAGHLPRCEAQDSAPFAPETTVNPTPTDSPSPTPTVSSRVTTPPATPTPTPTPSISPQMTPASSPSNTPVTKTQEVSAPKASPTTRPSTSPVSVIPLDSSYDANISLLANIIHLWNNLFDN